MFEKSGDPRVVVYVLAYAVGTHRHSGNMFINMIMLKDVKFKLRKHVSKMSIM